MYFERAFIPYRGYWSTPFCRWQGSFAHLHAIPFAADVAARALEERGILPQVFDSLYFGITVPQKHSFYGGPWLAGLMGAEITTGPMIGHVQVHEARWRDERALDLVISDVNQIIRQIQSDPTVKHAAARIYAPVLMAPEEDAFMAIVVGIQADVESQAYGLLSGMQESLAPGKVLIGHLLAKKTQARVGQEIAVIGQAADGSLANAFGLANDRHSPGLEGFETDPQFHVGLRAGKYHNRTGRFGHDAVDGVVAVQLGHPDIHGDDVWLQ